MLVNLLQQHALANCGEWAAWLYSRGLEFLVSTPCRRLQETESCALVGSFLVSTCRAPKAHLQGPTDGPYRRTTLSQRLCQDFTFLDCRALIRPRSLWFVLFGQVWELADMGALASKPTGGPPSFHPREGSWQGQPPFGFLRPQAESLASEASEGEPPRPDPPSSGTTTPRPPQAPKTSTDKSAFQGFCQGGGSDKALWSESQGGDFTCDAGAGYFPSGT